MAISISAFILFCKAKFSKLEVISVLFDFFRYHTCNPSSFCKSSRFLTSSANFCFIADGESASKVVVVVVVMSLLRKLPLGL